MPKPTTVGLFVCMHGEFSQGLDAQKLLDSESRQGLGYLRLHTQRPSAPLVLLVFHVLLSCRIIMPTFFKMSAESDDLGGAVIEWSPIPRITSVVAGSPADLAGCKSEACLARVGGTCAGNSAGFSGIFRRTVGMRSLSKHRCRS